MATIVIIEDEPDIVTLYRSVLERAGHQVVGAWGHPDELLAWAESAPAPDLLILDERLHGASGVAYLPALRQRLPALRVLVATADPNAMGEAMRLGAEGVLKKPFPLRRLVEHVAALVGPPPAPATG